MIKDNINKVLISAILLLSIGVHVANGTISAVQQFTARGRVVDAKDGSPLSGVSIAVKGGSRTTVSDRQGNFAIEVPTNRSVLVFTFVGYALQEYTLAGELANLTVYMEPMVTAIDEVEISVPYGTETKASITGSAVVIKGEQLADRPRSTFQTSLQGNVPGLQVMESTGQPGAAPTVRLRGLTSFSGTVTPLYVIDGVPMLTQGVAGLAFSSNSGAGINPNDIEDITVLKDGSASSIYGSQGANGVILITTKSGKAGKTRINMSANYGQNRMAFGDRAKPLNTAEMTQLLIEGVINSNINPTLEAITTPEAAYLYLVQNGLNPDVDTDWTDVITQIGQYSQYNVSASGGNDKTNFFVSGGYYKQDAVTKGQGYDRKTGRLNINHKANDKLSFNGRIALTAQHLNTVPGAGTGQNPVRSLYRFVPWLSPLDENGEYNSQITYNPLVVQNENRYETHIYQAIGNVGAAYQFTDYLTYEGKAGIDFHYSDDYRYWSPIWPDGRGVNGRGMEYNRLWNNWTVNNLLRYKDEFGDFGVTATLGQEAAKRNLKSVSTQAQNFVAEDLYTLANTSEPYIAWSSRSHATLASYFLNTSFNYQQKYYLNVTGRRDGSSRFGKQVRWANFWSLGASWNVHRESFMENLDFVNQLKFRISYGTSGNMLGEYYGALGFYSTNQNYMGHPGFAIGQIESGLLQWELNRPLDIGLEFSVLNNRLSGTFDWYTRQTSRLIQDMPVSHTNGVTQLNFNVGGMKNYGVEISLSSHNVVGENGSFDWRTDFNITTLNNRITAIQDGRRYEGRYVREVGGDYYQFRMRGYAGVERTTGQALWFTDSTRTATTTEFNQAGIFKQEGKSALADFYGGFTNTFSYKGFSLSALIYFNWGNSVYDTWGPYTHSDGSAMLGEAALMSRMVYRHRWRQPGDDAEYPKIVYGGNQSGQNDYHSTRFLYDGSYIRLRDVTLSYSLPVQRLRLPFASASIYFRANNLYTWVKDDLLPYDPEVGYGGQYDQNLPIAKQYALGIDISFR